MVLVQHWTYITSVSTWGYGHYYSEIGAHSMMLEEGPATHLAEEPVKSSCNSPPINILLFQLHIPLLLFRSDKLQWERQSLKGLSWAKLRAFPPTFSPVYLAVLKSPETSQGESCTWLAIVNKLFQGGSLLAWTFSPYTIVRKPCIPPLFVIAMVIRWAPGYHSVMQTLGSQAAHILPVSHRSKLLHDCHPWYTQFESRVILCKATFVSTKATIEGLYFAIWSLTSFLLPLSFSPLTFHTKIDILIFLKDPFYTSGLSPWGKRNTTILLWFARFLDWFIQLSLIQYLIYMYGVWLGSYR